MAYSDATAVPAFGPSVRMASWSFYLGLFGFILVALSPIARAVPLVLPLMLYGGLAFGAIAVILGIVGLASINRTSAIAGLLLGALAIATYFLYSMYLSLLP